jgi:hypothetical protein
MVVHENWKYIGEGQEYVAFLVRDHVVKVPRPYFNRRRSRSQTPNAIRVADFDLDEIPNDMIRTWIGYGKQQMRNSKYYGDFGVPTYVDSFGLIHQQYVAGKEPTTYEQTKEFKDLLETEGLMAGDLHMGNFKLTQSGPKMFDYSSSPLRRRKRKG